MKLSLRVLFVRALGPAACGLLFLAAYLLLPRENGLPPGVPARICLVDASASVRQPRPDWLSWVRTELARQARTAREAGEDIGVIVFASSVARLQRAGSPDELLDRLVGRAGTPLDPRPLAGDPGASRLAAALTLALDEALAGERRPGRVVLLGNGGSTGADPAPVLARLLRSGVALERVQPPPPELGDLALLELDLPPRIEIDALLAGRASLSYAPGVRPPERASLAVELEGAVGVRSLSIPLEVPPAGGSFEVSLRLGRVGFGRTVVRVRARLEARDARGELVPDPVPANDRLAASTRAEGELVIGVVAEAADTEAARAWLAPTGGSSLPGVQWVFTTPMELPATIDDLDALVSFDLSPAHLPAGLVTDFVRRGGGWLATSGWSFLSGWFPGAPAGTATHLTRILPLEPAPLDRPPREVVLLVDGSGSMAGEPFEIVRRAAVDLVAAALPTDRVTLRFFRTRLEPPHVIKERTDEPQPGAAERAAARLLELEVPDGSTFVLSSLEEFSRASYADEVLALLLTDGEEREGIADVAGRAEALHARLAQANRRVVAIAVGAKARVGFLRQLVPPGDEVVRVEELEDLRTVFRREVSGAQVRDGEIPIEPAPRAAGSLASSIEGGGEELPPLERLVRNRVRPGAEVLWQSDEGDPVLGVARSGEGRTALFSSLPLSGWAAGYTGRYGMGEPRTFGAVLRWLARRERRADRALVARVEGGQLLVTGFDARFAARVPVRIVDPVGDRELARVVLVPPAPPLPEALLGHDPREVRTAPLPPLEPEVRPILVVPDPDSTRADHLVPVRLPRLPEYAHAERPWPSGVAAPVETGPVTAGRTATGAAAHHPLGPPLLAVGLALAFAAALLGTWRPRQGFPGDSR